MFGPFWKVLKTYYCQTIINAYELHLLPFKLQSENKIKLHRVKKEYKKDKSNFKVLKRIINLKHMF